MPQICFLQLHWYRSSLFTSVPPLDVCSWGCQVMNTFMDDLVWSWLTPLICGWYAHTSFLDNYFLGPVLVICFSVEFLASHSSVPEALFFLNFSSCLTSVLPVIGLIFIQHPSLLNSGMLPLPQVEASSSFCLTFSWFDTLIHSLVLSYFCHKAFPNQYLTLRGYVLCCLAALLSSVILIL